ncbi:MAG: hypothetical protein ACREQ5_06305 [Candidatus Dormibacteria bacterium]
MYDPQEAQDHRSLALAYHRQAEAENWQGDSVKSQATFDLAKAHIAYAELLEA